MVWICAYFAILLLSGRRHFSWSASARDYHLGGRKFGASRIAFSISATAIGGSATIGMTGLAWQVGWPAFWWLGSGVIGLFLLGFLLAKKIRKTGAMTIPEIISIYLCPECRPVSSIIIIIAYLAVNAAQFSAMGTIISGLGNLAQDKAIVTGTMAVFIYTFAGGQKAVINSDLWQFCLLLLALLITLFLFIANPEGREAISAMPLQIVNAEFPISRLIYFLVILGGTYLIGPVLFGRVLSAQNGIAAKKGAFFSAIGIFIIAVIIVLIGIASRGFGIVVSKPEDALIKALESSSPEWVMIIVSLGLFSAIISSADSCLLTSASIAANDLLGRNNAAVTRICMVCLTIPACWLAINGEGILTLLLAANDIYVCGIAAPLLIGLIAGAPHSMNDKAAISAMIAGGIAGICAAFYKTPMFSYIGISISIMLCLIGLCPRFIRKIP